MHSEGPTAVMRIEHKQIKQHLEKIRSKIAAKDPSTGDPEASLIEILTAHNQKEEGVLYPWFDRFLNAREQEEALSRIRTSPTK